MVALNPVLFRAVDPDGGVHHFTRRPENVCTEVAWATADGRATIHHGDCLDVMRTMAEGSVDAVVCDPPYGLEFMGKEWDAPWKQGFAEFGMKDGNRRAAPVFGSKRNPCCRTCRKHKRGTKRCECPKPDFDETPATFAQSFGAWCEGWAVEALRVAKPGAHLLAFGGTRTYHRLACAIEDAGWEIRDCLSWLYGSGFPKSHNGAWGGTALKPAWEPVIMARKPLIGTVAANHAAHGTGALNIDGCRIKAEEGANLDGGRVSSKSDGWDRPWKHNDSATTAARERGDAAVAKAEALGRWPANVALDEDAAAALDEQSGESRSAIACGVSRSNGVLKHGGENYRPSHGTETRVTEDEGYGDFGGASRFFYTAKASRSEREAGLREAEARSGLGGTMPTDDDGADRDRFKVTARNTHPTVKPVDLMRWLVRLVTPMGGTVLDPFLGSGTTLVAAIEEGCKAIGIEREAQYVEIAKARVAHAAAQGALFS